MMSKILKNMDDEDDEAEIVPKKSISPRDR